MLQALRGKKRDVGAASQVVDASLILLEGRVAAGEKELESSLEQLQEVRTCSSPTVKLMIPSNRVFFSQTGGAFALFDG